MYTQPQHVSVLIAVFDMLLTTGPTTVASHGHTDPLKNNVSVSVCLHKGFGLKCTGHKEHSFFALVIYEKKKSTY